MLVSRAYIYIFFSNRCVSILTYVHWCSLSCYSDYYLIIKGDYYDQGLWMINGYDCCLPMYSRYNYCAVEDVP